MSETEVTPVYLTCTTTVKRSEREAAFSSVTSIMQEQDLVKLLAGSAALFPRGLIVVLQQQNLEPMENQQPLKLAPAHRPHWSASPTSGAPFGKPLTMGLNCSQRIQTGVSNAATRGQSSCFNWLSWAEQNQNISQTNPQSLFMFDWWFLIYYLDDVKH